MAEFNIKRTRTVEIDCPQMKPPQKTDYSASVGMFTGLLLGCVGGPIGAVVGAVLGGWMGDCDDRKRYERDLANYRNAKRN